MQPSKSRNGNDSTSKGDKHMFIPPGALGKGRAQFGLRSFYSLRPSTSQSVGAATTPSLDTPIVQSNDISLPQDFEPMEEAHIGEESRETDSTSITKKRKVRGKNKCKEVAKLKSGKKLNVKFYNNRVVGKNHRVFSRHLGRIVRDHNICPFRVHSWKEIGEEEKEHMWAAVTDKFENTKIEEFREDILAHMNDLWNKWRGDLHRKYVKPCNTIQDTLRNIPEDIDRENWEWLVKEHFLSKKFLAASKRNSNNRAKLTMPHRTGSKPIRQVIWKKGGKVGEPPSLATIFFETRKKGDKLVSQDTIKQYEKIIDATQSESSLSNIELVEKCFGPQRHNHIVCYGGGLKPNDMKTVGTRAELQAKLRETQRKNDSLKNRMDEMEVEIRMIKEMFQRQHFDNPPTSSEG